MHTILEAGVLRSSVWAAPDDEFSWAGPAGHGQEGYKKAPARQERRRISRVTLLPFGPATYRSTFNLDQVTTSFPRRGLLGPCFPSFEDHHNAGDWTIGLDGSVLSRLR